MTTPTKPYATSAQVAFLIPNMINNRTDFNETDTMPRKSAVDQFLNWISQQIDMQFQQAGYIIPFTEISGETWPAHQTYYLQLLCSLGTAALAGGHSTKPAPAIAPGRGVAAGNVFQNLYDMELRKIWDGSNSYIRFRTMAYSGTPAEHSITQPIGPSLDYMVGKMNPEDFLMFEDYTQLRKNITDYVSASWDSIGPINWYDFHGIVADKLLGYSYNG